MSWEELENKTLWDITTNENPIMLMLIGTVCFILAVMYSIIEVYMFGLG